MTGRYNLWINLTVDADSEDDAFDFAFEAMSLADGQGLMDHRTETLASWSVEGPGDSEKMWTTCGKCGLMNIEIVDDGGGGSAAEFCEKCDD